MARTKRKHAHGQRGAVCVRFKCSVDNLRRTWSCHSHSRLRSQRTEAAVLGETCKWGFGHASFTKQKDALLKKELRGSWFKQGRLINASFQCPTVLSVLRGYVNIICESLLLRNWAFEALKQNRFTCFPPLLSWLVSVHPASSGRQMRKHWSVRSSGQCKIAANIIFFFRLWPAVKSKK